MGADGETYYTRNGKFGWAVGTNGMLLANSDGHPVLDTYGDPIELDAEEYDLTKITIDSNGKLNYPNATNNDEPLDIQIGLVQFSNPAGLNKEGDTLLAATEASGEPVLEAESDTVEKSVIRQGWIESSNVQIVEEMVNLIVAQRAYEMNSKAIVASDEMLQQANQLKR